MEPLLPEMRTTSRILLLNLVKDFAFFERQGRPQCNDDRQGRDQIPSAEPISTVLAARAPWHVAADLHGGGEFEGAVEGVQEKGDQDR